jgi:hypothetical protein
MKRLFLFIALVLPIVAFAQRQRLGIHATESPITITKEHSGTADAFCSDGHARSLGYETRGEFNYFQAPESVEVIADGEKIRGGIEELIEKKYITVNTRYRPDETLSNFYVDFQLNENSPYKSISINFREGNILADTKGDFNLEAAWSDELHGLKVLPDEAKTFAEAKPYLEKFQTANGLPASGLLTTETRIVLEKAVENMQILKETRYLNADFSSFEDYQLAEKKFKYDYDVKDIRSVSKYLTNSRFMSNFNKIKYDQTYEGEIKIRNRNIRPIYRQELAVKNILSREIKAYNNHRNHAYFIHTSTGTIRIELLKNEHAVIHLIQHFDVA